jgi:chitin-binding protein
MLHRRWFINWGCVLAMLLALASTQVGAHGATYFPIARIYKCYQDGGFWSGNMPNAACRQAHEAGVAWDDWHGLNRDVPDNENFDNVKRAIPDGTLCSANNPKFRGLDVLSSAWYRTPVKLENGKFQLKFQATAPHNPSGWKIFLSKPGYSTTRPLRWDDLDLIASYGNIPVTTDPITGQRFYLMDVTVPAGRSGDATLYVIWQRTRPHSIEGFYECSDITLEGAGGAPEFPWTEKDNFVQPSQQPSVGDVVRFRVLSAQRGGNEVVDVKLPITGQNQSVHVWTRELVGLLQPHENVVKVGVRAGNDIRFDANNVYSNLVYVKNENDTPVLEIETPPPPAPGEPITATLIVPATVASGATLPVRVDAKSADNKPLTYTWHRPASLFSGTIGNSASGNYTAAVVNQDTPGDIYVQISDGTHTLTTPSQRVTVLARPGDGENPGQPGHCYEAWSRSKVYGTISSTNPAAKVTHNGRNFEQQWWTQGDEPIPGTQKYSGKPWVDIGACEQ